VNLARAAIAQNREKIMIEKRTKDNLRKIIRIIEVPLYLMVIALGCFQTNAEAMGIILVIISIARLFINAITDQHTYRK
jgi:hypothetical protein